MLKVVSGRSVIVNSFIDRMIHQMNTERWMLFAVRGRFPIIPLRLWLCVNPACRGVCDVRFQLNLMTKIALCLNSSMWHFLLFCHTKQLYKVFLKKPWDVGRICWAHAIHLAFIFKLWHKLGVCTAVTAVQNRKGAKALTKNIISLIMLQSARTAAGLFFR